MAAIVLGALQGMCEGGHENLVLQGWSEDEGLRPEQCYPYYYGGNPEEHFTANVDSVSCAFAYQHRSARYRPCELLAFAGTNTQGGAAPST